MAKRIESARTVPDFDVEDEDATAGCYACGDDFTPPRRVRTARAEVLCPSCCVDEDHAEALEEDARLAFALAEV